MTASVPVEATQRQTKEQVAGLRGGGLEQSRKDGGQEASGKGLQAV